MVDESFIPNDDWSISDVGTSAISSSIGSSSEVVYVNSDVEVIGVTISNVSVSTNYFLKACSDVCKFRASLGVVGLGVIDHSRGNISGINEGCIDCSYVLKYDVRNC